MPKYIECEPLVEEVWSSMEDNPHADGAISLNHEHEHQHFLHLIARQPAADVAPVVHGRWEPNEVYGIETVFACSECARKVKVTNDYFGKPSTHASTIYPYCHCGARMDGGDQT